MVSGCVSVVPLVFGAAHFRGRLGVRLLNKQRSSCRGGDSCSVAFVVGGLDHRPPRPPGSMLGAVKRAGKSERYAFRAPSTLGGGSHTRAPTARRGNNIEPGGRGGRPPPRRLSVINSNTGVGFLVRAFPTGNELESPPGLTSGCVSVAFRVCRPAAILEPRSTEGHLGQRRQRRKPFWPVVPLFLFSHESVRSRDGQGR